MKTMCFIQFCDLKGSIFGNFPIPRPETKCTLEDISFRTTNGVRQGGPESPPLFNLYIDFVMRIFCHACEKEGIDFLEFLYDIPASAGTYTSALADADTLAFAGPPTSAFADSDMSALAGKHRRWPVKRIEKVPNAAQNARSLSHGLAMPMILFYFCPLFRGFKSALIYQ